MLINFIIGNDFLYLNIISIKYILILLSFFTISSFFNTAECAGPEVIEPVKKCFFCGFTKGLKNLFFGKGLDPVKNSILLINPENMGK